MTLNSALFKYSPRDTFVYFRTNQREFIIKVGITNNLNRRDSEYSTYPIPTKYHTTSSTTFVRYIADKNYEEEMKSICRSFGGVNYDANYDGHNNQEWFQFHDENSFRHACDSLSGYINSLR